MDFETCKEKRKVISQYYTYSKNGKKLGELLVKIMNSTGTRGTWEIVK